MSTNFSDENQQSGDWISQAEAARIHGVTRQAINKLVQSGRLRCFDIGGRVLVSREDVEKFRPQTPGRPAGEDMRQFERIRVLLESCNKVTLDRLYEYLRLQRPRHPIEDRLGANVDVILEAMNRAGELTTRMFRGIIAEAAFGVHIANTLHGWQSQQITGGPSYDFMLVDKVGPVSVQVKLQRSERGVPIIRNGYFVVETQRTRGGKRTREGGGDERTRPYRYGAFDILAVSLQPSSGRWDDFRYTVGDWLLPQESDSTLLSTYQPVAPDPNEDWSESFQTSVEWFRSRVEKKIAGQLRPRQ